MNDHKKNRIMTDTYTDPMTATEQENDYLQQQADDAKAAIGNAICEAKTALTQGMDPKAWTRKYPLIAVGSALAAGFAAAVVTISTKEQQELERLREISKALHPETTAPPASAKPGFWSGLIREAVQMIQPVLTAALMASLKAPPSSQEPKDPSKPAPPG
jgi:hypothetical protein